MQYDRLRTEWLSSGRSSSYVVQKHVVTITELVIASLEHAKVFR